MKNPASQDDIDIQPGGSRSESPLPRIVRNSTFNALGMMLIVPLNFVALFTMARRLGAESMGVYFTIFATCAVIHWIADAGTSTVLTRRVARTPHDLRLILAEAMGVMLVVIASSLLLFTAISIPWTAVSLGFVPWMVLAVAASAMAARHALDFASNVFRGLERFEFENLGRVIQAGLFCLFVWFGVARGEQGTLQAMVAYSVSNYIAVALIWSILLTKWCCPLPRLGGGIAHRWFKESFPLGVGDVVRQLYLQIDLLMLAMFRPAAAVGLFSVASRPLQPLRLVPRTIVSVTFPMMSRTAHIDREKFSRMFARTTNLLWVGSLPICIGVAACAAPLVLATAGRDFAGAIGPLRWLIWSTVLLFINTQLRFVFTALDAEHQYWRLTIGSLIGKVILGGAFIALFGLYGACAAVLFGECIVAGWGLWMLQAMQVTGPGWRQLARAMPPAVAMALVLWPFAHADTPLWINAIALVAGSVVYLVGCLLTGAWPRSDAMQIMQAFRRSFAGAPPTLAPSRGP